jgi:tetratricopeptide (TPR) repeat protein
LATLYPAYLRGQAYLAMQKGEAAAGEFQKILDHPGIALNFPIAALAHLQLGRALAAMGAASDARREYLEFLTLWKEADSNVPVLAAARAEYDRLKRSASRLSKAPRPGRLVTSTATVPAIRRD